jgi:hypothetical protein
VTLGKLLLCSGPKLGLNSIFKLQATKKGTENIRCLAGGKNEHCHKKRGYVLYVHACLGPNRHGFHEATELTFQGRLLLGRKHNPVCLRLSYTICKSKRLRTDCCLLLTCSLPHSLCEGQFCGGHSVFEI